MRYQISGHPPSWLYSARIIAACLVAGAVFAMVVGDWNWAIGLLAAAALLAGVVEIHAAVVRGRAAWIEVLPDSAKISDRRGEREIQDHEFVSMAYAVQPKYSNGLAAGYWRICRVWTTLDQVIELKNQFALGEADPLAEFIQRVAELLKEGFSQALAHGVEVRGDGWRLSSTTLYCGVPGRERVIELAKITAVHETDGMLGVWVRDENLPTVMFPLESRNAWMLPDLVEPYMEKRPAQEEPPREGLGRILFRRRTNRAVIIATMVLAAFLMAIGGFGALEIDQETPAFFLFLGVGAVLGVVAVHLQVADFCCHEWGVTQRNLLGRRQLLYRDIESFTYSATRNFVNGVYSGTALNLRFTPRAGCGRSIAHHSNVQGDDADLDNLRMWVSQIIATQMHVRLANGETVAWTNNLGFSPEGFLYRPSGFIARGKQVLLPYENYHGYNLQDGFFYLFEKGKNNAVIAENVGEANFFPGFCLLMQLAHSGDAAAEGSSAEQA